jgi:hypothetical protein
VQRVFYFVVNKQLNSSVNMDVSYTTNSNKTSLGQSTSNHTANIQQLTTTFKNNSYILITTNDDEVVLDFSKNIKDIHSIDGNRLAASVYGVSSSLDHIHNERTWLAIIAYVLALVLICLHAVYVGNELIYKVDNWLIFAQSLYYFSFVHLPINASIGQFYYGFYFAHFGFFPNYFAAAIPPNYM